MTISNQQISTQIIDTRTYVFVTRNHVLHTKTHVFAMKSHVLDRMTRVFVKKSALDLWKFAFCWRTLAFSLWSSSLWNFLLQSFSLWSFSLWSLASLLREFALSLRKHASSHKKRKIVSRIWISEINSIENHWCHEIWFRNQFSSFLHLSIQADSRHEKKTSSALNSFYVFQEFRSRMTYQSISRDLRENERKFQNLKKQTSSRVSPQQIQIFEKSEKFEFSLWWIVHYQSISFLKNQFATRRRNQWSRYYNMLSMKWSRRSSCSRHHSKKRWRDLEKFQASCETKWASSEKDSRVEETIEILHQDFESARTSLREKVALLQ